VYAAAATATHLIQNS
jgi:hypothetical protein